MSAKKRLLIFAIFLAGWLGLVNVDTYAATVTSVASGNWNSGSTWNTGTVPADNDVVVINHAVTVNTDLTAANTKSVNNLTIGTGGSLLPDIGSRAIEINGNLTVSGDGYTLYNNGSGRLNWYFTGTSDATPTITNTSSLDEAAIKFNNITFQGGSTAMSSDNGFEVYGNMVVTTAGQFTSAAFNASTDEIIFKNTTSQTITADGSCVLENVHLDDNVVVTAQSNATYTNNGFSMHGNLTTDAGSTLTLSNGDYIFNGTGTTTITNNGTLTVASGVSVTQTGTDVTLAGNISGFAGTWITSTNTLNFATYVLSGTGNITTVSTTTLSLANSNGLKAALALSGTRTFPTTGDGVNVNFLAGVAAQITGFDYSSGLDLTRVNNLDVATGVTTSSDDSYTLTGNLTTTGTGIYTANSGTITMTTTNTLTDNAGTITLYNVATSTSGTTTVAASSNVNIKGNLTVAASTTWTSTDNTGTLTFNGTSTVTNAGTFSPGSITITGSVTLASGITLVDVGATTPNVTLNGASAVLDFSTFTLTLTGTNTNPQLTLTAGTVKTGSATGLAGSLASLDANTEFVVAAGINLEFYGAATTMGLTFTNISGAGQTGNTDINATGNITISGAAAITSLGTGAITRTITGNLTVSGTASLVLAYNATDDIIAFVGPSVISVSSSATTPLQFNQLIHTSGTLTTSASFKIAGVFTNTAGALTQTAGTVTFNTANNTLNAAAGSVTFFNVDVANASTLTLGSATSDFTVNGNLSTTGTGVITTTNAGATITLAGTSKTATFAAAGSVLGTLVTSGTYTMTGDIDIMAAGAITVSGASASFNQTSGTVTIVNLATITNTGGGTLSFNSLTNTSGNTVFAGASTLTIKDNFTVTAGTLVPNTSTLTLTAADGTATISSGAAIVLANVAFSPSGASGAYTISGSGVSVGTAATIAATATLNVSTASALTGAGTLTATSGATIAVSGPAAGITSAVNITTVTGGSGVNVSFSGATPTTLGLTGQWTAVKDLTISATAITSAAGGAAFTVNGNVTVTGAGADPAFNVADQMILAGTSKTVTVDASATSFTIGDLEVTGSYTMTGNATIIGITGSGNADDIDVTGSFVHSSGTLTFTGAAPNIFNSGTLTFNNVTITGSDITTASSFNIAGNLSPNATASLDATAGTITFNGTSVITLLASNTAGVGASTAGVEFFNLAVTGTATVDDGGTGYVIDIAGTSINVSGSLTPAASSTYGINIEADGTITNTGTLTFSDLSIGTSVGNIEVTSTSDFTIADDLTLQATSALSSTGTTTFSGSAGVIALSTSTTPSDATSTLTDGLRLKNIIVSGTGVTTTGAVEIVHTGDLTVQTGASFIPINTSAWIFDGASTKTITNNGTLTFGDVNIRDLASNNVETASDFSVDGDEFYVGGVSSGVAGTLGGTFVASAGTVDFTSSAGTVKIQNLTTSATGVTFYGLEYSGTAASTDFFDNASNTDEFHVKGDLTVSNTANAQFEDNTKVWLSGTVEQTVTVSSTGTLTVFDMTLSNTAGAKLSGDIAADELLVRGTLRLQGSDLDLNGDNILTLDESTTPLLNEVSNYTVKNSGVQTATGHILISAWNPGGAMTNNPMFGIGAILTTASNPNPLTIKRYATPRTIAGVNGVSRYFDISSATTGLSATLKFKYNTDELSGLTESNLKLLKSNTSTGPWYYATATLNTTDHTLITTGIDAFTSTNVIWTASTPGILTADTALIKDVETSPLVAGRTSQVVYGIKLSASSGTIAISNMDFTVNGAATAATVFSGNMKLYRSTDNHYTSADELVSTIAAPASATVTFPSLTESIAYGSDVYYYIIADVATSVTAATTATSLQLANTGLTVTEGVVSSFTYAGTSFSFEPGIQVSPILNGVVTSPLVAAQTGKAIFGMQVEGTSSTSFNTFTITTTSNTDTKFRNVKLYVSTDADYATSSDNTQIAITAAIDTLQSDAIYLTFAAQTINTTAKNYFVVADILSNVDAGTAAIEMSMSTSDIDGAAASPNYKDVDDNASTSFTEYNYTFSKSTTTVAAADAGGIIAYNTNITKGANNMPLFRFSITPDAGQSVTFTGLTAQTTLSSLGNLDILNYRLFYDANQNGFPDPSEVISSGTYNSAVTKGNLTFGTFSTTQTFSATRYYIIAANVATNATTSGTVTVSIPDQDYIVFTSPAKANAFSSSSVTGSARTVRASASATAYKLVGQSASSVITGNTVSFAVQAVTSLGYPANVASADLITLTPTTITASGTTTGTILSGSSFIAITPTFSGSNGTVLASGSGGLTNSASSGTITVVTAAPTGQGVVSTSALTSTGMTISLAAGTSDGTGGRVIVMRAGQPPVAPINGSDYTAATAGDISTCGAVGTGQTAQGSFVIFEQTGAVSATTVAVTGLTPGVTYYIEVFDYNGTGTGTSYYTTATTTSRTRATTTTGTSGATTAASATNIQTDVEVSGSITAASQAKWYQFRLDAGRSNALITLTDLPKNYTVEMYDANERLIRSSAMSSTSNETIILNAAVAGVYKLKVYGYDTDQYSATTYSLKVTTSASAFMSQR